MLDRLNISQLSEKIPGLHYLGSSTIGVYFKVYNCSIGLGVYFNSTAWGVGSSLTRMLSRQEKKGEPVYSNSEAKYKKIDNAIKEVKESKNITSDDEMPYEGNVREQIESHYNKLVTATQRQAALHTANIAVLVSPIIATAAYFSSISVMPFLSTTILTYSADKLSNGLLSRLVDNQDKEHSYFKPAFIALPFLACLPFCSLGTALLAAIPPIIYLGSRHLTSVNMDSTLDYTLANVKEYLTTMNLQDSQFKQDFTDRLANEIARINNGYAGLTA